MVDPAPFFSLSRTYLSVDGTTGDFLVMQDLNHETTWISIAERY